VNREAMAVGGGSQGVPAAGDIIQDRMVSYFRHAK
jgi:hypothetical protein